MKKVLFFAAMALVAASCAEDKFIGDVSTAPQDNSPSETNAIVFSTASQGVTRAGEFVGATAAEKLGGMFVVEGTKGTEGTDKPSDKVVFDNYLVGYEYNHAGKTESDTHNWEYVGKEAGITGSTIGSTSSSDRMSGDTWRILHSGSTDAKAQSIKYWDYSEDQYDFIAWSTGKCEAIATGSASDGKVKVTRIATGTNLSSTTAPGAFTLSAYDADDLMECYYTDITPVKNGDYGKPVTLTFRNMAAKVRVALYETVPGYSVKDVKFYSAESDKASTTDKYDPEDLGTGSSADNAVLFTTGEVKLPQSGSVLVYYPRIGTGNHGKDDYNKASVTVSPGTSTSSTQEFGALTNYVGAEAHEATGSYLGRKLPDATFAGSSAVNYYTAVIPNTNPQPLTLRLDYTLVSTDGSTEEIKVYGAKAVVPSTYTKWLPNYAYTYIFKISDNTNGWTSKTATDPNGLFPITFDAVVTSFIDANDEQTTVTTVATPSITTYQQGHTKANNEYSKSQTAGADLGNVKDLYVQVMDNSGATPSLKTDLNTAGKSLLFKVNKANASEAEVMDALQNRTNLYDAESPVGRNGITLTTNSHIANNVASIINGVDDQPIGVASGSAAKIDIDHEDVVAGTYAYVYVIDIPSKDERVYNVVSATTADASPTSYYEVKPSDIVVAAEATAQANKVYFVANRNAQNDIVSYTFKQTKEGESVTDLYEATIDPNDKADDYTEGYFYFDVYNQNNGAYAVKVIKVVN
ncbi:MAG: hypothetical protein IJ886_09175 [Prevotella sp.]|nr:hypothetical protein [Prevotella sp.]